MSVFNAARYISVILILNFDVTELQKSKRNCSSLFDCGGRRCCIVGFKPLVTVCSKNCVGKACRIDHDCGHLDSECCDNNVCTNDAKRCGCQYFRDPECYRNGKYCCKPRVKHRLRSCKDKCENHPCSSNYECAKGECCNINNMCSSHCGHLQACNADSDCNHAFNCCAYKRDTNGTLIKACMYSCDMKRCITNDDCKRLNQCCGNEKVCEDCKNSPYSWTKFIIIACVILVIIISAVGALTCYCRRKGRCVLFKPRFQDETIELHSDSDTGAPENSSPVQNSPLDQNFPPPPYSIVDQSFSTLHNLEFPPIYESQEN